MGSFLFATSLIAQSNLEASSGNSSEVQQIEIQSDEDGQDDLQGDSAEETAEAQPVAEGPEAEASIEGDCEPNLQLTSSSQNTGDCAGQISQTIADPVQDETEEILLREDGAYIKVPGSHSVDQQGLKTTDPNSDVPVQ
ncbi:hypothetical protein Z946_2273 [Sulfitobacter noctilucicola]|uniref:Uncharacterized protein n=1 Tax=Sulfitobacter noctilucicola TaxID=1342301 RepID=A0A7W6MA60_9RHOB|nr:hypothetical protein [Sulfitobacter noctilucicola]KIN63402.1 hypothetical protein Z946_2273 [Sulfitobacter noctilucicola]MBB4175081.1 hypothetical protein [Sulfitobacter noctilucicola]